MYVQLRATKDVIIDGNVERCYTGDWVDVGKQTALRWIAQGDAWVPDERLSGILPADAGVMIRGDLAAKVQFGNLITDLQVSEGALELRYTHTLLWASSLPLPKHLIGAGFHLLEKWQLVVPLWDYEHLALTAGSPRDRERAGEVLHDLRVPLYETCFIFAKRAPETRNLMERWARWGKRISNERLAFLCALYEAKPLVCALPCLDRPQVP